MLRYALRDFASRVFVRQWRLDRVGTSLAESVAGRLSSVGRVTGEGVIMIVVAVVEVTKRRKTAVLEYTGDQGRAL